MSFSKTTIVTHNEFAWQVVNSEKPLEKLEPGILTFLKHSKSIFLNTYPNISLQWHLFAMCNVPLYEWRSYRTSEFSVSQYASVRCSCHKWVERDLIFFSRFTSSVRIGEHKDRLERTDYNDGWQVWSFTEAPVARQPWTTLSHILTSRERERERERERDLWMVIPNNLIVENRICTCNSQIWFPKNSDK